MSLGFLGKVDRPKASRLECRRWGWRLREPCPVGRSQGIIGLVVSSIVTLLTIGIAVAQDATWKDCELGARNPDRSIAACSKLLKRPSSRAHASAFHHRALAFEAQGKLDQAISDVSAGIRLDPQPAYRWQKRGELYARQGKYQQAIADITEAIRKDPTPRAFRFQSRADAYQGLGDLTRAIADYDQAIRLDPDSRSFRFRARANALRDAGQYERALADYATALKLEPTNVWALVDRGRTYTRMGRPERAKSDFDNALTLDPSNAELRHAIEVEVGALPKQSSPPAPPSQKAEDATYAEIGWWSIDYLTLQDIGVGCHATALFKDQTLLSIALVYRDESRAWLIRISNPGWKNWIKNKKQHTLRLVTNKTWQDTFFVVPGDEEALYSGDISVDFMNTIADAKTLEIFNDKNRSLASLDMKDSTNAIKAVVNCAGKHAREVREAGTRTAPQETPQEGTTSSGTGFFIAPNLVVTNKHVVDGCRTIDVRYPDQTPTTAAISGQDSTNDLALLRTSLHGQSVASFHLGPRLGETVAAYGFPYRGILSSSGNFTLGNVTSMTGIGDDTRFFQTSTPIQPGNSGGPLLDMSGAVV